MSAGFPLYLRSGQPYVRDLDLATALGMHRPIDIRTGLIKLYVTGPMHYGFMIWEDDGGVAVSVDPSRAYLLTEEQARFVCHFSTSRRADDTARAVVTAFAQHKSLSVLLREALTRTMGDAAAGREAMFIDALKARLRQTVKVRRYTTRRRRMPQPFGSKRPSFG